MAERKAIVHGMPVIDEMREGFEHSGLTVLLRAAAKGKKGIVFINRSGNNERISYRQLYQNARVLSAGLMTLTFSGPRILMFQVADNRDFIELFWACQMSRIVPVPVQTAEEYDTASSGVKRILNIWEVLNYPYIISSERNFEQVRKLSKWNQAISVYAIKDLYEKSGDHFGFQYEPNVSKKDLALIMFTSGSTGTPKGVKLSHHNLLSLAAGQVALNEFTDKDISFNWMPLTHVGGIIYFHIRDVYLGAEQIQAETEHILQEPLRWLDYMHKYQCQITWAPNFAYKLVVDKLRPNGNWDLSRAHTFLNGGEAVSARTGRTFLTELAQYGLPGNALKPSYGMSETSSGITYNQNFSLESVHEDDTFVSAGKIIPGNSMRIVDDRSQLVGEEVIGHFQVMGKTITSGYYGNKDATAESFCEGGWFDTGDLAFIKDGEVTITGRSKEMIISNGANYYLYEIEAVLEEIFGIKKAGTAACPVKKAGSTKEELIIFFSTETHEQERISREIRKQVFETFRLTVSDILCVPVELILKTEIGKIQHKQMADQYLQGRYAMYSLAGGKKKELKDSADMQPLFTQVWVKISNAAEEKPIYNVELKQGFMEIPEKGNIEHFVDWDSIEGARRAGIAIRFWYYIQPGNEDKIESAEFLVELQQVIRALKALEYDKAALYLVTENALMVKDGETINRNAVYQGAAVCMAEEHPALTVRLVDTDRSVSVERLTRGKYDNDIKIYAYRQGACYIPQLQLFAGDSEKRHTPFSTGLYLVTGGNGGIGSVLGKYLTEQCRADVIVAGRADKCSEWGRREEFAGSGGVITYIQDDLTDYRALETKISAVCQKQQKPLTGIFHLAGSVSKDKNSHWSDLDKHLLEHEIPESFTECFKSKVIGTEHLVRIKEKYEGCFLFALSSVNQLFGGTGLSAYSAANAYLSEYSKSIRAIAENVYCLNISNVEGIGMTAVIPAHMRIMSKRKGFESVDPSVCIRIMEFMAATDTGHLYTGIDLNNAHICAYGLEKKNDQEVQESILSKSASQYIRKPENDMEQVLHDIWAAVLQEYEFGTDESFFDLGGTSLNSFELLEQVNMQLGAEMKMVDLFEYSTISQMAEYIAQERGCEDEKKQVGVSF